MLNSAPGVLVKYINKEFVYWNLCIQYIENIKSCLIKLTLHFIFGMLNKCIRCTI
jgi:hypothetical protein